MLNLSSQAWKGANMEENRTRKMLDHIQSIRDNAREEAKQFSDEEIRQLPLAVIQDLLYRIKYGNDPQSMDDIYKYMNST